MSVVDKPIQDGIGDGWILHVLMPGVDRELGGDDGGKEAVTVFDDFEKIPAFGVGHGSEAEVIEDEDMGSGDLFHDFRIGTVCLGDTEFLEEAGKSYVEG